jgi:hypothetical protein
MTQEMNNLNLNGDLILNEIKHMRTGIDKLDKRMEKAESNMSLAVAQSNRIDAIALNIVSLEHKAEIQERDLKAVINFQASCPRDSLNKGLDSIKIEMQSAIKNQWVAIGILATALIATGFWNQVVK